MKTKKTTRVSKRHQINEFNPVATSAYGKGRDMTFRERNKSIIFQKYYQNGCAELVRHKLLALADNCI